MNTFAGRNPNAFTQTKCCVLQQTSSAFGAGVGQIDGIPQQSAASEIVEAIFHAIGSVPPDPFRADLRAGIRSALIGFLAWLF